MIAPEEPTWDFLRQQFARKPSARSDVALWSIEVLEQYLGISWMPVAFRRRELPEFIWHALISHNSLLDLVETALWIEGHRVTNGRARVRRDCRSDVSRGRLFHARLQMETASLARSLGHHVALEAKQATDYVADVQVGDDLFVECQVAWPTEGDTAATQVFDEISMKLFQLQSEHGVDVSGTIDPSEPELLRRDVDDLSVLLQLPMDEGPMEITGWASTLRVDRGGRGPGRALRAAPRRTDLGRHLAGKISSKADQVGAEDSVWLRVDARNHIWQHTHLYRASLEQKLEQLGDYALALAGQRPGVAGVVLSSGICDLWGELEETRVAGADGRVALARVLPLRRARETLIVPCSERGLSEVGLWQEIYWQEATWLPGALAAMSLPTLDEIFA